VKAVRADIHTLQAVRTDPRGQEGQVVRFAVVVVVAVGVADTVRK
jgi:hypothetical protein